jgi:hypothetical protein
VGDHVKNNTYQQNRSKIRLGLFLTYDKCQVRVSASEKRKTCNSSESIVAVKVNIESPTNIVKMTIKTICCHMRQGLKKLG